MSFKGLVTRKDQDTGVQLLAKIVTPNKKKSTKKIFSVKVKSNGLDDYSCCVIDHSTVVSRLNSQGLSDLLTGLSLLYNGVNGTRISYSILDQGQVKLSNYLQEDGKLIAKPRYGEEDVTGQLVINVTKGEALVSSSVQIVIKALSAYEVLNNEAINITNIWNNIRGENGTISNLENTNGPTNIEKQLNFVSTYPCSAISATPLELSYAITDRAIATAIAGGFTTNTVLGESRISQNGAVTVLSYKTSYDMYNALNGTTVNAALINDSTNNAKYLRYRIGGITLVVTATLGGEQRNFTYDCAILNSYISNQEIVDAIAEPVNGEIVLKAFRASDNMPLSYAVEKGTGVALTASGSEMKIRTFGETGSELLKVDALGLDEGQITDVVISSSLYEFGSSTLIASTDPEAYRDVFGGGFNPDGTGDTAKRYQILTIDFESMKAAVDGGKDTRNRFCIGTTVTASSYNTGDRFSKEIFLQVTINGLSALQFTDEE